MCYPRVFSSLFQFIFALVLTKAFAEDPTKISRSIVDVECRIGDSLRCRARKYGAQCQGITLSPIQAQRAQALAAAQGLSDKVCLM